MIKVIYIAFLNMLNFLHAFFDITKSYITQFILSTEKGQCIENGKACLSGNKPCCEGLTCKPIGGVLLGVCTDKGMIFQTIINPLILCICNNMIGYIRILMISNIILK